MNFSFPAAAIATGLVLTSAGVLADVDVQTPPSVSVPGMEASLESSERLEKSRPADDSSRSKNLFLTPPTPLTQGQATGVVIILTGPNAASVAAKK